MPSYNTALYIAESIQSVIDQTYKNWELLIVDDCSTDNTDEVVASFKDDRIKYLKNNKNQGAALTRNTALREARGEWIAFLDSDDLWRPEKLKKMLSFMKANNYVFAFHDFEKIDEIRAIAEKHNALIVEDAAESFGATYKGTQTGTFGYNGCISANGNKIITGSCGGFLLTNSLEVANKIRKWSTQSRENAPWYQHEEISYNYRMSNVVARVIRGQLPYLEEHISQKRAIYNRYKEGLKDLPVTMNSYDEKNSVPNFWLSCLLINKDAMSPMVRGDKDYLYKSEKGKSSPHEILDALMSFNAEGRPIWKPMHLQPIYRNHAFVTREGNGRGRSNAYISGKGSDVGADIFQRGLCLPSDNKMTVEQQNKVIEITHRYFE